jgi:hypothetical protein
MGQWDESLDEAEYSCYALAEQKVKREGLWLTSGLINRVHPKKSRSLIRWRENLRQADEWPTVTYAVNKRWMNFGC